MDRSAVIHACLVSIDGVGVVITGDSGVGKTSVCLELEKLGHPFLADDSVEIRYRGIDVLGTAPPETAGKVAIRGIGIIDGAARSKVDRHDARVSIKFVIELTAIETSPVNQAIDPLFTNLPIRRLVNSDAASTALSIESHIRTSISRCHDKSYG